ncbi:hypothetical protein M0R45_035593 [Rubus argutus]|uniref:Uncharacterized protein n=1 Tax=Rubus argutus TaxID=59490 RepID=A0AAW1VTN0_RUBAR
MAKTRNTTQHKCNPQSSLQVRQSAMKSKETTAKSCRRKPIQEKKKGKAAKEKLSRTKISEEANALSADEFEIGSQEAEESEEDEYASDDNLESNNPKNLGPSDNPLYGVKRHYPSKPRDETRLKLHVDIDCHISQIRLLNKVKGCGNHRLCAEWYISLPASIKHRIKDAGFGEFVKILKTSNNADRQLLLALAESLQVVDDIGKYNWGGAALACLYKNMDAVSRVWACEYIIPLALTNPGPVDTWPRANRWLGGKFGKRKVGHNLKQLRKTLEGLRNHHLNIDPWAEHEEPPSYVTANKEVTKKRIYFMDQRVTRGSMMTDYEYTEVERTDGIVGWPCERFIDNELDYTSFKEEYIKYHEYPDTETYEERKVAVWELFAGKESTGGQRADCSWWLWMVTGNCNDPIDVWHEIPMPPGDITLPKCNTESYSLEHFSIEENNRARWATLDDNVKAITDTVVNKLLGNINGLRLLLLSQALAARDDFKLLKMEKDKEIDSLRTEIERLKTPKKSRVEHEEHEEHEMHNVMEPSVLHKSTDPIYAPKAGKRDNVGRDHDIIFESETHGVAVDGQEYVITPETEDHDFAVETEGHKIDDRGFDMQLDSPRDDHGFND